MHERLKDLILDSAKEGLRIETSIVALPRGEYSTLVKIFRPDGIGSHETGFPDFFSDSWIESSFRDLKQRALSDLKHHV
jgi:hypothetical protein